ncbi:MAG: hypothetical protein KW793_04300 [Candidatus Doudnabacteria bacterium]|nr:hypothetical protein [Candidatus Doudnabacteria bacterium]
MNSYKHKIISTLLVTVATYFGFQALDLISGIYQIETYFMVAWYVAIFHTFWLLFIFDLHLKIKGHWAHAYSKYAGIEAFFYALKLRIRHFYHWLYVKKYLTYLILPSIFYWSVVILMYLNPFHELFKDALIIISTVSLSITYWHFKEAFSKHMEMHQTGLKIQNLVKLLAGYLMYTALLAVGWYFGFSLLALMLVVFVMTFLLVYQALYQHRLIKGEVYPAILVLSTLITLIFAVVSLKWNVNYYSAGLMVSASYNLCWSVFHRYLHRTLPRKLLWEYVFMFIVLISLILSTHDFQGRI